MDLGWLSMDLPWIFYGFHGSRVDFHGPSLWRPKDLEGFPWVWDGSGVDFPWNSWIWGGFPWIWDGPGVVLLWIHGSWLDFHGFGMDFLRIYISSDLCFIGFEKAKRQPLRIAHEYINLPEVGGRGARL